MTRCYNRLHLPLVFYLIGFVRICLGADQSYSIPLVTVDDCLSDPSDIIHQFYDISQLECKDCTQNSTYQIGSSDGLSCSCTPTHYREDIFENDQFTWRCEPCPNGQIASADGYSCVDCDTSGVNCPLCSGDLQITVERYLNGTRIQDILTDDDVRTCVTCIDDTSPSGNEENRCTRCNNILTVQPLIGCLCTENKLSGGMCFRDANDLVPDSADLYTVIYENNVAVQSKFFRENVRSSHAACVNQSIDTNRPMSEYSNLTACQLLGNTCVMSLYSQNFKPPNSAANDACSLHMRLVQSYADSTFPPHIDGVWTIYNQIQEWRSSMPWLYYEADSAPQILIDTSISQVYRPGMALTFMAAKYTPKGEFVSMKTVSPQELQICQDTQERLSKVFSFGVQYEKTCDISLESLYNDEFYDTYFYDLYLQYTSGDNVLLYAIPILITNFLDENQQYVNQDEDRNQWQFLRRFFIVDRISGVPLDGTVPQVIRYAESMTLYINLQEAQDGLIHPPYLEITYKQILETDASVGRTVKAAFRTKYSMNTDKFDRGIAISAAIICVLAIFYSALRTFTWNKRMGKVALDFFSLVMFLIYCCSTLATALFIVSFGFSIIWFIFYKGQAIFYLVPADRGDYYIKAFLGSAFALKSIYIIYLILHQVTVDLFLVDWEKSKRLETQNDIALQVMRGQGLSEDLDTIIKRQKKNCVSIWRTYMVANEWNEIQTVRRVNPVIHMLLVLMLLYCVGMEELTRYEPEATVSYNDETYHGEYNLVFRFAVFTLVYILVAFAQRIFYWLIWSRFKPHPITNFIDLCTLTNISVFVMVHEQFGYYIHGRSPMGFTDVNLRKSLQNYKREQENRCGTRGLVPGEDQQTFETAIPHRFRVDYNRVLMQLRLRLSKKTNTPRAQTRITVEMEEKIQAYFVLNKFLQNYIDHNIPNLDYIVTKKSLTEKVLDTETKDSSYLGYFYYDYGHAFDKAIFYGHEATLQMFEILFFTMVDMLSYDYILAGVLTYVIDVIIVKTRQILGKRNVARKTLVDDRFLI